MRRLLLIALLAGCSAPQTAPQPALTAPQPAEATATPAPEPEPALEDLGAQFWMSEPTSNVAGPSVVAFVSVEPVEKKSELTVEMFTRRTRALVCNPDSSCPACNLEQPTLPQQLDCTLYPDTEHEVKRAVTLTPLDDTVTLTVEGYTRLHETGPLTFTLKRTNPILLGFITPKERASGEGDSAVTGALVNDLARLVAEEGVDPMSLPEELANELAEKGALTNLQAAGMPEAREELLRGLVQDRLVRWRDKHPR